MKYSVMDKIFVNSHQTARSHLQASKHVIEYIDQLEEVGSILDFGCGKLRYSKLLKDKCNQLCLVDSLEQIKANQIVHGEKTTIRNYVESKMSNTILLDFESFLKTKDQYDLIFCSNVLSSIPDKKIRSQILNKFRSSLKNNGKVIIINQYWNSFYSELRGRDTTIDYEEGILTLDGNKSKYYGLLDKTTITSILVNESYKNIVCWYQDQICFVECN